MNVLALVESPHHVCARYRVLAFRPALIRRGLSLQIQSLSTNPVRRIAQLRDAARYDIVLLQRKLLPRWQLALLRRAARRLVFDFDDAILYRDSFDPRGPHCPRRRRRFAALMRSVDAVLAGNPFLGQLAVDHGLPAPRLTLIPTCIDCHRYHPKSAPSSTPLTLVWIGSSSTLQGLETSAPLWRRIGREVPGVRLRLVCDRFCRFDPLPVEPIPWSEAIEAAAVASADVGISWLPDDLWSRGKCGLKLLQYMAAGLPVVANSVGVQTSLITHGQNGFLAHSDDDWINLLVELTAHPDARQRLGLNARRFVERHYDLRAWESTFLDALTASRPLPLRPHAIAASTPGPIPAGDRP
ncbi:MAG: hypothetical protein KatS3mg108_3119 [Isosphaeraceae bacterium]|jgi:glycosyltransferase involved in cell wall biosynthesis|nr:MAG: hypothetical protein KatS3mg108_3119 [Isosphaeraceae bacterium]